MKTMRIFLMILAAGMLFLSACAAQPSQPVQANPTVPPAPDGTQTVTLEDQGKTIDLAVGDSFLLKLGEQFNWDIAISDPSVISRVINIMVVRGAQGVYQAHKAGTVTLNATGDPQCRQSQPACAMPSIQFSITVVVK